MNVYEFFKYFTLSRISDYGSASCTMHLHYDSVGREENNFQQLSKLIQLRFIATT